MESLQAEIDRLQIELKAERDKRIQLEEECDLLAEDNSRLRSELDNARYNTRPPIAPPSGEIGASAVVASESVATTEVFVEGDGNFAKTCHRTIPNASSGKNIVSTAIFHSSVDETLRDIAFVGGVDAVLRGFAMHDGTELFVKELPGPVLFIDCQPPFIACGMMDGSHMVGHLDTVTAELSTVEFKNHSKYVVGVRWSPSAKYYATASYDKSVIVYRRITSLDTKAAEDKDNSNPADAFEKYKTMQFQETPESLIFSSDDELIVGLRGLPHLLYIDLESFSQRNVSLNEHEWDLHVSLVPLALSISPCRKYLLVATDKHMHLILRLGSNQRMRLLTGHITGDYGKPSVAWDASGAYVYTNSDEENMVYVYCLATQRVVQRLSSHTSIVRSLSAHPVYLGVLVTGSYDKSVKFWRAISV